VYLRVIVNIEIQTLIEVCTENEGCITRTKYSNRKRIEIELNVEGTGDHAT
jgi:hypothetical protein